MLRGGLFPNLLLFRHEELSAQRWWSGGPGTGTRVVLAVLKCHRLKNGSVASMVDRSSPAHGAEDGTPQVAVCALGIATAMLRQKRGIVHVYGNNCCELSEESVVKRLSAQRRQRIDKRLDLSLRFLNLDSENLSLRVLKRQVNR